MKVVRCLLCCVFISVAQEDVTKLLHLLRYCQIDSNGRGFPAGYHTLMLDGKCIQGRRDPLKRLSHVPYDFTGKTVLDIGTNIGGMLFAVADKIKWGVGIDYNVRAINAAHKLRSYYQYNTLNFYTFDLMKEPLSVIDDFLPNSKVDICFFLAMGMWLKNWRLVIDYISTKTDVLLLETNGDSKRQEETVSYVRKFFSKIQLLASYSDDDLKSTFRKMYICFK